MKFDPEYYRYRPYNRRQKIVGPVGAHIAVWVVPNIEFYEFKAARHRVVCPIPARALQR